MLAQPSLTHHYTDIAAPTNDRNRIARQRKDFERLRDFSCYNQNERESSIKMEDNFMLSFSQLKDFLKINFSVRS